MKKFILAAVAACVAYTAYGKTCTLNIKSNDLMQFDQKTLFASASCKTVKLILLHVGKLPKTAMGHNWVLTKASDMKAIVTAGVSAGLPNNYLPTKDSRIIASTGTIGGGEKTEITFSTAKLNTKESYMFFCSFPGHAGIMSGTFLFR